MTTLVGMPASVLVGVAVAVAVLVGVPVFVGVPVSVGVPVFVGVSVFVAVLVAVEVEVGVGVGVGLPQVVIGLEEFWGSLGLRTKKSGLLLLESIQLPDDSRFRS
jgi:hypothetical protein